MSAGDQLDILLIDDHEVVLTGLQHLLSDAYPAARFDRAKDIREAHDRLFDRGWDLVVLDVNLPGGCGLGLLPRIKACAPRARVLVLTAYPEDKYALRAFKLGADGFLQKASVVEEVLEAVRRVLDGGKYVSPAMAEYLASALGASDTENAHESLSTRELEVLQMVAKGKTIKHIAAELSLSARTIGTYRTRVSRKLGLSTNVELARYALKFGLTD